MDKAVRELRTFRDKIWLPFCERLTHRKATVFFLLFLVTGVLLAYAKTKERFLLAIGISAAIFVVLILARRNRFWYRVLLPILTGSLLGVVQSILLWNVYAYPIQHLQATGACLDTTVEIEEIVATTAYSGKYIVRLKLEKEPFPYHVLLDTSDPSFEVGQVFAGSIQFRAWEKSLSAFEEETYYRGKSTLAAAVDSGLSDTGEVRHRLTYLMQRWNERLSAKIAAHVKNAGLPMAMLLGNRRKLSDAVERDFRRLGILHLLAVSGTHFTMLSDLLERTMRRNRVRPTIRHRVLVFFSIFYMLLTGLSASVRRAGVMFLLCQFCKSMEIQARYFSVLQIACGLIVLADPFSIVDAGLHLSYLAVCGCILTIHLESHWKSYRQLFRSPDLKAELSLPKWRQYLLPRRIAKRVLSTMLLNLIVTCLTLPLSWLYFGELSIVAMLANLVYIPATSVLLFLTVVYLVTYPLRICIRPMAAILSLYVTLLEAPASWVSHLPHVAVSLRYPFVPLFLLPAVLSVCSLPLLQRKSRGILCASLILCTMVGTIFGYEAVEQGKTTLSYRQVEKKEGFVLRSEGEFLLVDISDGSTVFLNTLLFDATNQYATEIGGYVMTHYHNRHVSTVRSLVDNWIVRCLYLPTPMSEEEWGIYRQLCAIAEEKHIPVVTLEGEMQVGVLSIEVGPRTWLSRSTHPITGVRFAVGDESVVYTSASYAETDPVIVDWMEGCTIGVFGIHSPVHKKTFDLSFVEKPKVILWNGNAREYYIGEETVAEYEYRSCERFAFQFFGVRE